MANRYQVMLPSGIFDLQTRRQIFYGTAEWDEYQAALSAGEELVPPNQLGQLSLSGAKTAMIAEMEAYASSLRNGVNRGRTSGELAMWLLKLHDAIAIKASQQSPYSALMADIAAYLGIGQTPDSISQALGVPQGLTKMQFATAFITRAVPMIAIELAIEVRRGQHRDGINACATVLEVMRYDWHTGWPAP